MLVTLQAGRTALHAAALSGNARITERLLKAPGVKATAREFIVR